MRKFHEWPFGDGYQIFNGLFVGILIFWLPLLAIYFL